MAAQEIKSTAGYYVGKELVKQGKKKDNSDYTLYKLKFKPVMETDKTFSFSCFAPITRQGSLGVDDLKDGTRYWINFTERDFLLKNGSHGTGKTISSIQSYEEGMNSQPKINPVAAQTTIQPSQGKVVTLAEDVIVRVNKLDGFQDLAVEYIKHVDTEKQSVNSLVGTYLLSKFEKEFQRLFDQARIIIAASKVDSKKAN